MGYVLGLDLGTSSIGAALLTLNEEKMPQSLLDHHVYIFKEPVTNQQGTLVSKKTARRENRQARKQRDRRNGRLQKLAFLCKKHFVSDSENSNFYLPEIHSDHKHYGSLALRAHGAKTKLNLQDFVAVILHLSKSRGYSSGFRPLSKAKIEKLETATTFEEKIKLFDGEVRPGVERLKEIMEMRQCKTIGQYLLDRAKRKLPSNLKCADRYYDKDVAEALDQEIETVTDRKTGQITQTYYNLYALREQIVEEFAIIWAQQSLHHKMLTPKLYEEFNQALFYQRPLKSVTPMVGNCLLEPNLPRAHRAHPQFQNFRIEKSLRDLRWGFGKRAQPLSTKELNIVRAALNDPSQLNEEGLLTFEKIYALLAPIRDKDAPHNLNLSKGDRPGLTGNITAKRWQNLGLLASWQNLADQAKIDGINRQTWVINFLADLGSEDRLYPADWCEQFRLPDLPAKGNKPARKRAQAAMFSDPLFINFINEFRALEKFKLLGQLRFDTGRASYCIKALEKIVTYFQECEQIGNEHFDESKVIEAIYQQKKEENNSIKFDRLRTPAKTGNGVVDLVLMQVKKVVNHFIDKHGLPARIVVEMNREMGKGLSSRNEQQKLQNQHNRSQKEAAANMRELGKPFSKNNVLRYRLAKDQNYDCPYCGKSFSAQQIYEGSSTQIEHIVPQSITQVGKKYSEIVLAHSECNYRKGKQVPMEAFSFDTGPIERMAKHLRGLSPKQEKKAKLLEMPETPQPGDNELEEFCDRQFNETAWITKLTASWLRSLGVNVECSRGTLTAQLRRQWQLNTVIPEMRMKEGLPLYGNLPDVNGDPTKEVIIDNAMLFDSQGQPTSLWDHWNDRLNHEQLIELRSKGQHYTFNKRCDHRHHLIDAITIALCDRSMVNYMAKEYKEKEEILQKQNQKDGRNRRVKFGKIECPIPLLRNQVLEAASAQRVTHRPDRNPSGAWFEETAYGLYQDSELANQQFLTKRLNVRELCGKDDASTIKNICDVVGIQVRDSLRKSYESFKDSNCIDTNQSGDAYKNAISHLWQTPPLHRRTGNPIVKVRTKKTALLESKHFVISHTDSLGVARYKVLIACENAYVIWHPKDPSQGYQVINNYQARKGKKVPLGWLCLSKGDVFYAKDGLAYIVYGISESNNKIETMRSMCAGGLKASQSEGRKDFLLTQAKRVGTFSLWDIKDIIQDPFDGKSKSSAH